MGLFIGVATFAAFLPALSNQLVNWDDYETLLENPHYRGLAPANLRWMFTTFFMGHYQPLSWLSFAADFQIWGADPFGYHLTNLLLHAANAVSFFYVARLLLGRHDFTTFRAAGCQARSPLKTLDRLDVGVVGEEVRIEASARSFLHNQVRSMVGSLKLVGEGKWSAHDLQAALEARDRAACGPVAPACGLYLVKVDY